MPADEFVKLVSGPTVLGDPDLKTQHFVGASRWERVSADEVVGYHQLRVPHQKKKTKKNNERKEKIVTTKMEGQKGRNGNKGMRWLPNRRPEVQRIVTLVRDRWTFWTDLVGNSSFFEIELIRKSYRRFRRTAR